MSPVAVITAATPNATPYPPSEAVRPMKAAANAKPSPSSAFRLPSAALRSSSGARPTARRNNAG